MVQSLFVKCFFSSFRLSLFAPFYRTLLGRVRCSVSDVCFESSTGTLGRRVPSSSPKDDPMLPLFSRVTVYVDTGDL